MEQDKMEPKLVLRLYWRFLAGFRWPFFAVMGVIALASAIGLAVPWMYKWIFDTLSDPAVSAGRDISGLLRIIFLLGAVHGVTWMVWRVTGFGSAMIYPAAERRLRLAAFDHLVRHSYAFFSNRFSGSLVRQMSRFCDALGRLGDKIQWSLVPLVTALTGITIILFFRHVWLGLAVLGWIILFIVINFWLSLWKLKYDMRRSAADSKVTGTLADIITNISNVKFFSAYDDERALYDDVVEKHRRLWKFTWDLSEIITAVQTFLMIGVEVGVMYLGVRLWQDGILTVGDFALLQGYLISLFDKLWDFGRTIREIYEQLADATEMAEILDSSHAVQDVRGAKRLKVDRGRIEFQDVGFSYHKTRRVLDGLQLVIAPGEKVALVGPSGAGKSTVTKLLLRLHDLEGGKILIDGQDIARVKQESLWDAIALVPQEPILFHRTLMENIRYGRRDATDKEVLHASKLAHCHEFIEELPQGYETFVGERGVKLSGGERQRVAIARAILKNAPILVLDEATSSLDSESESLIQDALKKLMKGKTVIVIAHRLSTIMQMDRIVVIDRGRVTNMGTHAELLQTEGIYKTLWDIQAGGFLPAH